MNKQEQAAVRSAIEILTPLTGPPGGHKPEDMVAAGEAYVVANLCCTPADFDRGFTSDMVSAAIVERNTEISPSQGAPIYGGTPVGQAYFDAATTDDTTIDVFAFKGTSNIPSVRHAINNNRQMTGNGKEFVIGVAEVWGWKADGSVWNIKQGKRLADLVDKPQSAETVIVSGQPNTETVS